MHRKTSFSPLDEITGTVDSDIINVTSFIPSSVS